MLNYQELLLGSLSCEKVAEHISRTAYNSEQIMVLKNQISICRLIKGESQQT